MNKGLLQMSEKERSRKAIMEMVKHKTYSLKIASEQMGLSYRQTKRIWSRYKLEGDVGLIHRSRGRPSNRVYNEEIRVKVLNLYKEKYYEFGPTFASEKLLESDGISIKAETLRLWLKESNLWVRHRKRSRYRSRREPKEHFGELVQIDGSIHQWFNDKYTCLMNMVDDATGKTLALLDEHESTGAAMTLLLRWIKRYGIPKALYVDLKNVYVLPSKEGEPEALTHFGKACQRLGIQIIKAYSPQAKGRVERNHAVYQDRLVKEIKLNNLRTIEDINKFMESGFINKLNRKFAKKPLSDVDFHRRHTGYDLKNIFCWEYTRILQRDWTLSFDGKTYQIKKEYGSSVSPRSQIIVRKLLNGSLHFYYKNEKLQVQPIQIRKEPTKEVREFNLPKKKSKSPWRTYNSNWLSNKKGTPAKHVESCG